MKLSHNYFLVIPFFLLLIITVSAQNNFVVDSNLVKKLSSINTKDRENNPIVSSDGKIMFFNSTRKGTRAWATFDSLNNRFDEDIYFTRRLSTNNSVEEWSDPVNLGSKINTKSDEGVVSVSPDCKKIYFTSVKRGWLLDGGPFYYAQLRDTQLTNFKGLGGGITMFFRNNTKLNEKGDEDIHSKRFRLYGASISADGKDFYFATTAGTKSGFHEIFVSHFKNREWTYPQTLGSPINDSDYGNYAPFIAADGHTLFFSSNRPDGYGGDDIYVSINKDGYWQKPVNIGSPINTPTNESFISMTASGENIYICSTRDSSEDIYTTPLSSILPPQYVVMLRGTVLDSISENPLGARILAEETQTGDALFNTSSDGKNGTYSAVLESGKRYTFTVIAPGYKLFSIGYQVPKNTTYRELMYNFKLTPISTTTSLENFNPTNEESDVNDPRSKDENIEGEDDENEPTSKQIQLKGIITDKKSNKPLKGVVTLIDTETGDTLNIKKATQNGAYKINIDQGIDYTIHISEPKHYPVSIPYKVPETIYRRIVTSDFQLDKIEDVSPSLVENLRNSKVESDKNPKKNRTKEILERNDSTKNKTLDLRKLNGTITDIGTGVPLSSNIYLNESKSGNQAASTNSLTDGLYEIKLIPGIKYDIVVRAEGYSPETKSLIIPKSSSKQEFTYNFSLSKLNEINSKNNSLSTFVNKVIEPSENKIDNNMEALYTNKNQQQNDLEEYVTTKPIMSFGGKDLEVNPLFINLNAPFNYGTATVNPILYPQLDSLISMMKNDESMRIQIGGHTDNVGSSSYNKYLSQLRADAVKIYLIEKGQFQNYRIKSKGFGLDQPIDTNESDQGRTNNRRVEIKLLKNKLIKKFKLTSK